MPNFDAAALEEARKFLSIDYTFNNFYEKYYVLRKIVTDKIEEDIKKALTQKYLKVLFCSHSGSGKTTILRHLERDIKNDESLYPIFLSFKHDVTWIDNYFTEILLLIVKKTIEKIQIKNQRVIQNLFSILDKFTLECEFIK